MNVADITDAAIARLSVMVVGDRYCQRPRSSHHTSGCDEFELLRLILVIWFYERKLILRLHIQMYTFFYTIVIE